MEVLKGGDASTSRIPVTPAPLTPQR
jgi:hypothetical protein